MNGSKNRTGLLLNLTKLEYAEGARLALANAKDFVIVAEFCQRNDMFAKGTTHLVFALEELSKAAMLQLKALNPQICVTNLYDYFHKHSTKHLTIQQLVNALEASSIDTTSNVKEPSKEAVGLGVIAIVALLVIGYLLIKNAEGRSSPAPEIAPQPDNRTFHEILRQTGLYVEFKETTRSWVSPNDQIGEPIYTLLAEQVQNALAVVETHLFESNASAEWAVDIADALKDEAIMTKLARKQLKPLS